MVTQKGILPCHCCTSLPSASPSLPPQAMGIFLFASLHCSPTQQEAKILLLLLPIPVWCLACRRSCFCSRKSRPQEGWGHTYFFFSKCWYLMWCWERKAKGCKLSFWLAKEEAEAHWSQVAPWQGIKLQSLTRHPYMQRRKPNECRHPVTGQTQRHVAWCKLPFPALTQTAFKK